MKNRNIYFLMVLSALFWAGAFIAAKLSAPHIPVFTLTFLRFLIATLILYFVISFKEKSIYKLKKQDIPVFLFTGIVGMVGYHIFFFKASLYTTAINSSIIAASNPIITTILSFIFLKDKLNYKGIAGILLSFTGVILTITNGNVKAITSINFNRGDILMLLAVLCWAAYGVYSKKVMPRYSPMTLTFYSFLFCTLFLIPFVIYENPMALINKVPTYSYIAVVYMSIFASVIGYLVQQMSIKQIGPSRTSIFVNLVPIFSIILSALILNESITIVKIFAAVFIITGVYICQRFK
ncbi:DMT family transporter [Clostridium brassicae]|uniref:DMT family transporter n=1 Tax=Clostridium brassicae TaxID=2999072 RepID=A0ABT4D8Q7_9CLOT|nr:DMT family transporter [Clostridium brassicae]MCY6958038.1 DMT family transporter [Clostridium brassicae]